VDLLKFQINVIFRFNVIVAELVAKCHKNRCYEEQQQQQQQTTKLAPKANRDGELCFESFIKRVYQVNLRSRSVIYCLFQRIHQPDLVTFMYRSR
jgi:hypothetical protein